MEELGYRQTFETCRRGLVALWPHFTHQFTSEIIRVTKNRHILMLCFNGRRKYVSLLAITITTSQLTIEPSFQTSRTFRLHNISNSIKCMVLVITAKEGGRTWKTIRK